MINIPPNQPTCVSNDNMPYTVQGTYVVMWENNAESKYPWTMTKIIFHEQSLASTIKNVSGIIVVWS